MAKSKSYEMLLKIAGKTDSSLKAACNTAAKNIDALGKTAKNAGKMIAGAAAAGARRGNHRGGRGKGRVGL